jgi:wyosine [tRNA(Phe)-imidazoG37] synthetase (radical SAM superfamily)
MPGREIADKLKKDSRMPISLHECIVYGPVRSRRLGRSLGVNLLPPGMKVCNMKCAYCQYGWTRSDPQSHKSRGWPTPATVEEAVATRLRRAADTNELIDRLTVAGHGEPTLHPQFEAVAEGIHAVRNRIAPGIPTVVLSNSTTAMWPDVRRALALFDERHMKLDAGDPFTSALINGPCTSVHDVVDALCDLPDVTVQSMFVRDQSGQVDNTTDGAVKEWVSALERIRPTRVHIYTLDREPAAAKLRPVPAPRLREICEHVRAAGFAATVFEPGGQT